MKTNGWRGFEPAARIATPVSALLEEVSLGWLVDALCLPAVCDFNNVAVPDRIERVRRLVDLTSTSLSNALRALRETIGLPSGLSAEGVTKSDVPKLADKAMEDACHRSNPRAVTRDDMVKLYEQSL